MSQSLPAKIFIRLILILVLIISQSACATVPGTGRSQLSLVGDDSLAVAAASQYHEMLSKSPLSKDAKSTGAVKKVGAKISKAAEVYLQKYGLAADIPLYKWEFNLIESPQVNAFCMPGGKVAFYTGILPYCQDETGLAVIMGHEVAHAIAKHSREQASQKLASQIGETILSLGLAFGGIDPGFSEAALGLYGAGTELGFLLPYSRTHETEADRIGLSLMAMAGYDPRQAVGFWQRMAEASEGGGLGFLSTHPTDQRRIADIQAFLPEALTLYQPKSEKAGPIRKK